LELHVPTIGLNCRKTDKVSHTPGKPALSHRIWSSVWQIAFPAEHAAFRASEFHLLTGEVDRNAFRNRQLLWHSGVPFRWSSLRAATRRRLHRSPEHSQWARARQIRGTSRVWSALVKLESHGPATYWQRSLSPLRRRATLPVHLKRIVRARDHGRSGPADPHGASPVGPAQSEQRARKPSSRFTSSRLITRPFRIFSGPLVTVNAFFDPASWQRSTRTLPT